MPEIPDEAVEAAEKVLKGNYWVEDYYAGRGEIAELAQATLEAAAPFLAAQEREARERLEITVAAQAEYEHDAVERLAELEAERLTPEEAERMVYGSHHLNCGQSREGKPAAAYFEPCTCGFATGRAKLRARASSPASVDPGGEA